MSVSGYNAFVHQNRQVWCPKTLEDARRLEEAIAKIANVGWLAGAQYASAWLWPDPNMTPTPLCDEEYLNRNVIVLFAPHNITVTARSVDGYVAFSEMPSLIDKLAFNIVAFMHPSRVA